MRISRESWTFGICESCLRNAHEEVRMKKENLISGGPESRYKKEMWVCSKCGFSRLL